MQHGFSDYPQLGHYLAYGKNTRKQAEEGGDCSTGQSPKKEKAGGGFEQQSGKSALSRWSFLLVIAPKNPCSCCMLLTFL